MYDSFTKRNNISIEPAEIKIRFEVPTELRAWLFYLIKSLKYSIESFRVIICQTSYQSPNPDNWGENSFMEEEIQQLLAQCKWHYIYDIIEKTLQSIPSKQQSDFIESINSYFLINGYGWKLEDGKILSRGDDSFEQSIKKAIESLGDENRDARSEIKKAIEDISKRPDPDISGAVQHSMAAVECLCKELLNDGTSTLGKLIASHKDKFPKPLDVALDKLWGFASEHGRHVNEGKIATYEEAELVVHICASLIPYLKRTLTPVNNEKPFCKNSD